MRCVSALVVANCASGVRAEGTHVATVRFGDIAEAAVERAIGRGSTMHCAGGFAIEDEDLKGSIKSIDGGRNSVMGLPETLLRDLFEQVGCLVQPS